MQKNIVALTLGGLVLLSTPAWSSENWIGDFDKAVEIAKKENKDLLVDFTGSDWCGWCIKLDNEVFSHEEFLSAVESDYVLVALDFPRKEENIAKVPNMERNRALQTKYGVRGFPTVLLMNSDGLVYGKTGYKAGGPEVYVEHLNGLRKTGRAPLMKAQEALAKFEKAEEGEAKLTALDEVLKIMAEVDFGSPMAKMLVDSARSALELDPDNAKGLKLRAVIGLANANEYSDDLLALAKSLDPKNEAGALEGQIHAMFQGVGDEPGARKALAELDALNAMQFKDKDKGFLLNYTAANWAARPLADSELAKKYAAVAKEIGNADGLRVQEMDAILSGDI